MAFEGVVNKILQRYWRMSRGLTLGAQAMVLDGDGHVLLVRHTYRKGWHFPGGGVEKHEAVGTALARELDEEVGVIIDGAPQLIGIFANFHKFPGDHIALFLVRKWTQPRAPEPNAEIAEQRFFATAALPEGIAAGTRDRITEHFDGATGSPNW